MAFDGQDGNRLQLKKIGPISSSYTSKLCFPFDKITRFLSFRVLRMTKDDVGQLEFQLSFDKNPWNHVMASVRI